MPASPNGEAVAQSELRELLQQAIQQACEQSLRYRELFEFGPDGYLITDGYGVILDVNHPASALLGCSKQHLLNKPLAFLLQEKERSRFYRWLAALLRSGRGSGTFDARLKGLTEDPLEVRLVVVPLMSESGRATVLRWQIRDQRHTRQTERALETQRQLADSVVESAEALILVVDDKGHVLRSNAYLHQISGYDVLDLRGHNWGDVLFSGEERPIAQRLVRDAIRLDSARSGELTLLTRDGDKRLVSWAARSFAIGDDRAVALIGHDATELRQAQQNRMQADRLVAIGKTAAALAHESRNALQRSQSCLTMLGLRLHGQPEALDLLNRLQQAQDDLHRLFEDVRGFASPMALVRQECNLRDVWRQAWEDLVLLRERLQVEFHEDPGDVDLCVRADRYRLRQVFRNLFENAISAAGASGTIDIHCAAADSFGEPAIELAICDNGPGFKESDKRKAFEPFFSTKSGGTGLGLAICRRVVEAHGGKIEIGPTDSPGAEIILTLPRGRGNDCSNSPPTDRSC
jgi:PAS domain S-box-containing protein